MKKLLVVAVVIGTVALYRQLAEELDDLVSQASRGIGHGRI